MASITGLDQVVRKLKDIEKRVVQAKKTVLKQVGEDLLMDSNPLVPVDKGDLKNSGYSKFDNSDTVEVGYTEEYAVYVHEDLDANHPNGGQAKYLQEPFEQNKDNYKRQIIEGIKRGLS